MRSSAASKETIKNLTDQPLPGATLKGTVKNLKGQLLPGVTVTLRSTGQAVHTDIKGKYALNLPPDINIEAALEPPDTLVLSHNAFLPKRVHVYRYGDEASVVMWASALRLTTEIPGWVDKPDKFVTFREDYLFDLINGGADLYREEGLVDGLFQVLDFKSNYTVDIFVFNFGTTQNALAMVAKKISTFSSKIPVPGFSETIAMGDKNLGGAIFYGQFDKFNVEISLSGYADPEKLKSDAALFLKAYQTKLSTFSSVTGIIR
jgi:hypothetical protein